MSNSNFGSGYCQSHFYITLQIDAAQGSRVYKKGKQLFTASVKKKLSVCFIYLLFTITHPYVFRVSKIQIKMLRNHSNYFKTLVAANSSQFAVRFFDGGHNFQILLTEFKNSRFKKSPKQR